MQWFSLCVAAHPSGCGFKITALTGSNVLFHIPADGSHRLIVSQPLNTTVTRPLGATVCTAVKGRSPTWMIHWAYNNVSVTMGEGVLGLLEMRQEVHV